MVAALALPFYKGNNKDHTISFQKICLTGDAAQFETAVKIIRRNYPEMAIQHVCSTSELGTATKESALVICLGTSLTYKEAIQLSQVYPAISLFMWSGEGTSSIAGSNNKNASGYIWH